MTNEITIPKKDSRAKVYLAPQHPEICGLLVGPGLESFHIKMKFSPISLFLEKKLKMLFWEKNNFFTDFSGSVAVSVSVAVTVLSKYVEF